MDYSIGTKVFDKWEIKRELGHGSYGTVYEIEKEDFGICTTSALKVIKIPHDEADIHNMMTEGMDDMSVTSFFESAVHEIVREIELMSEMKGCENVVHFEDHSVIVKEGGGIGWDILIRMELLTPLTDSLVGTPLSEPEVIKIGTDICKALVYCQKKDIIHRDIKAENIFVSDSGYYKLGDFGVARSMDKTTGASKKGTENYMAPEVYQSKPYNRTVDIYSLGILLYRLMNSNRPPLYPPFPEKVSFADRENALIERMQGKQLPAPANASEQLSRIILKACSYNSEDRYQSAEDMLNDLSMIAMNGITNNIANNINNNINNNTNNIANNISRANIQDVGHSDDDSEKTVSMFGAGNMVGNVAVTNKAVTNNAVINNAVTNSTVTNNAVKNNAVTNSVVTNREFEELSGEETVGIWNNTGINSTVNATGNNTVNVTGNATNNTIGNYNVKNAQNVPTTDRKVVVTATTQNAVAPTDTGSAAAEVTDKDDKGIFKKSWLIYYVAIALFAVVLVLLLCVYGK